MVRRRTAVYESDLTRKIGEESVGTWREKGGVFLKRCQNGGSKHGFRILVTSEDNGFG